MLLEASDTNNLYLYTNEEYNVFFVGMVTKVREV